MKKLMTLLFACVFISSAAFAQTNTSIVTQSDGEHFAGVLQVGANQSSDVTQSGLNNTALVGQYTDNDGPQEATVIQDGTANLAIVKQSQTGGGSNAPANTAYIEQIGDKNVSIQSQTAPGYNSGQHVWGYQDGTENKLVQTVKGGYTISLRAEQYGSENNSKQIADGAHIDGEILQDGTKNDATQKLYDLNIDARIDQNGYSNKAKQTFSGGIFSHSTDALIVQGGDDNVGLQFGSGYDLNAELYQTGCSNWSVQAQLGTNHSSVVTQTGHNNASVVVQYNL